MKKLNWMPCVITSPSVFILAMVSNNTLSKSLIITLFIAVVALLMSNE